MEISKEQVKNKIRSKTKSVLILLGVTIWLVIIAFASNLWFAKQAIRSVRITGNNFLSNGEINSIIDKQIMNIENSGLNLSAIKNSLLSNEYIEDANIWVNSKGFLGIDIKERKPLAIIVTDEGTPYFIDKYRKIFSYKLYSEFIELPIIRNMYASDKKNIVAILSTLKEKYPLLNTRISEIKHRKLDDEYILYLTFGSICINIGNIYNLENKLYAVQTFINNVILASNDLAIYKYLDARWENKIIIVGQL